MTEKNEKLPFSRAYDSLLEKKDLTPAEKLVLVVVCRYWPNPYWDSNLTIAQNVNFSERYVEKIINQLAKKECIKRGYAHIDIDGKPHTVRVIVPLCFPDKCRLKIDWVKPEQVDGQQTEQQDGLTPNSSSFLPELQDDLLDNKERLNNKATPAPLPAGGQASALLDDRKKEQQRTIERSTGGIGRPVNKVVGRLTPAQFEESRREKLAALRSSERKAEKNS
jgi:hypothetical protein